MKQAFKKTIKKFLCFTLIVATIIPFTSCLPDGNHHREYDNVIVVIGDGMGENHILNAIEYFDLNTPNFLQDKKQYLITSSLDGLTDSAAGGTALATGQKVHNYTVAKLNGNNLEQITSIAKTAKMKTGIITTDTLNGATPASFSAHADSREDTLQIIQSQSTSDVDLLLGRYSQNYFDNSAMFVSKGYNFIDNKDQLGLTNKNQKLLGLFNQIDSNYIDGNEYNLSLKQITQYAIEYLENKNGFFLMIEGAYIDKYSHKNQFHNAMSETRSLIDTIEYLYEYATDEKTAIFITADHETGGLKKIENTISEYDLLFTSTDHTSSQVPLYIKNYNLIPENFGYSSNNAWQNTIIFEACKSIICG